MTIAAEIRAAAAQRILIKDGAYGTQIQAERLQEADYRGEFALNHDQKGNNDLLNLTRPGIVAGIARRFVAAGADILATNSFNATRISQSDYGAEHLVGDINRAAARIIREVVGEATAADGRKRWVAGAIGPTAPATQRFLPSTAVASSITPRMIRAAARLMSPTRCSQP